MHSVNALQSKSIRLTNYGGNPVFSVLDLDLLGINSLTIQILYNPVDDSGLFYLAKIISQYHLLNGDAGNY